MERDHAGGHRPEAREASIRPASGGSRKNVKRLLALLGLAFAALLPLSVSANAQSGGEGMEQAVVEEMGVESDTTERSFASVKEEGRTQVNVMRTDENWAFGSAIIEAPKKRGHYPKGWLFVAEDSGEGWDVALEGSEGFADLASEAPEEVVNEGEKQTFAANSRNTQSTGQSAQAGYRTGLRLPWAKGTRWNFTGGPHGWNTGYDRPYAALDFTGIGNAQRVRASGKGRAYMMCSSDRGWIRILHANGYSTDYYHLANAINPPPGTMVNPGRILGFTGEDVSCGGAAYGRHVHFALLAGNKHISLHNRIIGGWTFKVGQAYNGYAQRGTVRRSPGNVIYNFGP